VILVDPQLESPVHIILDDKVQERRLVHDTDGSGNGVFYQRFFCPPYSAFNILPEETKAWDNSELSPKMSSMFNDIISQYKSGQYDAGEIPELCRRIILWSWTAQVHLTAKLITQEVIDLSSGSPWQDRTVVRLLQARLQLRTLEESIDVNMNALGIGSTNSIAKDGETQDWRSLLNTIKAGQRRIDLIYEFYTQTTSVHESILSNQQARGVKYLTSLATVFVPASLTAGIFAMAGDFAAGAHKFWVFWAVAPPTMAILSCILFAEVFRSVFRSVFKKVRNYLRSSREHEYQSKV